MKPLENDSSPMRLLLDESVPRRLRKALPNHDVKTVVEMGWGGVRNGKLLALATLTPRTYVKVEA